MGKTLRVLFIEDSEDDALLLAHHLGKEGYDVDQERVTNAEAMRAALKAKSWDVILCDYRLPEFSVSAALEVLTDAGADIPFLVVSGTIGEERAADLMRAGAHDLILKDNLARLVPAIERGLTEAEQRRERKRAERALRESEKRLRNFAEASSDWFWEMGPDLRFTYHSDRYFEITGIRPEDKIGTTRKHFVGESELEADAEKWTAHIADLEAHRPFKDFEYSFKTPDGELRHVRTSGIPVLNDEAKFQGYRGTGSDLTEHKQAEMQLQQAQKMETVGQLTGGIAHDFNNLLTVVLGNLHLAAEIAIDDKELHKRIEKASGAAKRGAELTKRLLAFSRRQVLAPEVIDLNATVTGMDDLLRRSLGEATEIYTSLEDGLWPIEIDPHQLEGALLNLAVNARDAMSSGGKLSIETFNTQLDEEYARRHDEVKSGPYVVLAVSDTGTGMPPDVAERVFEPFFTTKDIGKGSGLGLSMVYGFVKQSDGHIKIYSEEGHGTTVKLYLPPAASAALAGAQHSVPGSARTTSEVILVVEDDEDVREIAATMLRRLGYRVLEAETGTAALAMLDDHTEVDLLFTDMVMPGGMSGTDLARLAQERIPGLNVLFTSGYTEIAAIHGGIMEDGVELIAKPYEETQLAKRLRAILDGS